RAQQAMPEEPAFVHGVQSRSRGDSYVQRVIVHDRRDQRVRRCRRRNLHEQIVGQVALNVEARADPIAAVELVIHLGGPENLFGRLRYGWGPGWVKKPRGHPLGTLLIAGKPKRPVFYEGAPRRESAFILMEGGAPEIGCIAQVVKERRRRKIAASSVIVSVA